MKIAVSRTLLWLLVVFVGIEIGAGLYEACVLVPLWAGAPPDSVVSYNLQAIRPNPGPHFWMVSTPLVGLLGVANLVAAWRSRNAQRRWWLAGASGIVAIVALTFIYFVPALMGFEAARGGGEAGLAASVRRWEVLNWVRAAIYIASWLCIVRAYGNGAELAVASEPAQ